MPSDADRYPDLARVVGMIRETIERAFDMTLPPATTITGQVEAIVQAIYDAAADLPRPASTPATTDKTIFRYSIDLWDNAGDNIVEHLAGAEDFELAMATYRAAVSRWPGLVLTLRQGARVIEDSRQTRTA